MSLNDWILALHLLAAFAYVGSVVVFNAMIASLWRTDSTRRVASFMTVSKIATAMILAGSAGTLVFGVWLSISKDPYDPWDLWIIAAFVLWAAAGWLGTEAGKGYGNASLEAAKLAEAGTERSAAVGLGKAAGVVGALALVGWLVAVWAMGAKPT